MKSFKSRKKDLETMAVLAAASFVFYFLFRNNIFIFIALSLLILGLFFKGAAAKVSSLWLRFSGVLGAFNTRIILGLVYFTLLTPLAIAFRLFTKKHVNSPRSGYERSYFTIREHSFTASDLEKMW